MFQKIKVNDRKLKRILNKVQVIKVIIVNFDKDRRRKNLIDTHHYGITMTTSYLSNKDT